MNAQPTWSSLLLILIACASLLLLSLFIVATVLIASRHSLVAWQKLKSALAVLVWVVPAVAVVVLIGGRFGPRFKADAPLPTAAAPAALPTAATPAVNATAESAPASPPRLKVRKTLSDIPQWIAATSVNSGGAQEVLSSGRFATLALAEEDVTRMALARFQEHCYGEATRGLSGVELERQQQRLIAENAFLSRLARSITSSRTEEVEKFVVLIEQHAVKDLVGEVIDWDFGNGTRGKMYRAHLRLDFSPAFRDAVQVAARSELVGQRVLTLGGMLGLVTLMLGTAAGYFKLDDATGGLYRRRLKLAAAAMIAAGGLATAQVLGS
jgi:hypothetical protein